MYIFYQFVNILFDVLIMAVFARVLLSWFPSMLDTSIGRLLIEITEPILGPIRRIMPNFGMIDLSPMIAMFVLYIVQALILGVIPRY
jgi:YggT family protein